VGDAPESPDAGELGFVCNESMHTNELRAASNGGTTAEQPCEIGASPLSRGLLRSHVLCQVAGAVKFGADSNVLAGMNVLN
jgi:hypothetical protein